MHRINSYRFFISAIIVGILLSACTGLRKIPEGEYLFTGAEINYDSIELLSNKSAINAELYDLVKTTNTKFLWMRPFLSIHNFVKEPNKEKGIRYWIKYKIGEQPVKLSDLNLDQINVAMVNRLENRGHFHANSSYTVETKKKTADVHFEISPKPFYKIKSVLFPASTSTLSAEIKMTEEETLIKSGNPYALSVLKDERSRIDKYLKNNGYFYFSPDHLLFEADSTTGNREIDLALEIKPDIPKVSNTAYVIDKIYVFDDYSLENYTPDTTIFNNVYYISNNHFFNPPTILDAVFLTPEHVYSRQNHYNTLSYLMGLGVYKFANARFNISDTTKGTMTAGIYLTTLQKMSVGAEFSGAVKTNNYIGPGLNLNFKNRNTFRGAELFSVTLGGRFETQFSGDFQGETSYEITLDGTLTFPRFVPLRFSRNQSREYVPRTTIGIGGGIYSRVRYYELQSFNVTLGYSWQSSKRITQSFKPVDISFTNLANSSEEFQDYLDENPTIKRSFEEQIIIGSGYTFTYSNFYLKNNPSNFMISQGIEFSGNIASLITSAALGSKPTPENQHNILGVPFSQYVRLRNEIRYFRRIGRKNQIGIRTIAAAAIPYGNSATIPYVKQFFVGGTNSIRSFRARTVGPGTYAPPDSLSNVYVDQSGDIKLEASIEYRFPIYGYFKGAFFADAGNIWLVNKDKQRPGGQFDISSFAKELAVGAGLGLRIDFTFVIIRFDMAFPLRKPYLPEGERWVFDKIQLGNPSWRKDNMVFNIAIGYPF